jgi:hypothetical protein
METIQGDSRIVNITVGDDFLAIKFLSTWILFSMVMVLWVFFILVNTLL